MLSQTTSKVIKMETYQKIEKDINSVKEWNQEAGNKLHQQMIRAQNASWTKEGLADYMKSDEDVADEFYSDDDPLHAEIREIQDAIIGYYGE